MNESQAQDPETRETLKLVTQGRKSGLPHIVIVRFVFSEGAFFVMAGGLRSDWALNAISQGETKIRFGEYSQSVKCEISPDREEILKLFRRRYGTRLTNVWYSNSRLCLKFTPIGERSMRGEVRGENESNLSFDTWKKRGMNYYSAVSEAFDSASEEYDFTIRNNFINVWIRERSVKELLSLTRPEDILLEIGSGPGTEAIRLSKKVSGIVATDISGQMTSLLKRKVEALGLVSKVIPVQMSAFEVGQAARYLPKGKVRVAYSFNGALNCELRIKEFPFELSKIMAPGGFFVCSIRNVLCLSEVMTHAFAFQFNRMMPRIKQPVMVSVGGIDIPAYYYSPKNFANMFWPYFRVKRMIGLPALLPPAYLNGLYVKARRALSFIERVENAAAGFYPLNRLGDQTLLVFQRREGM